MYWQGESPLDLWSGPQTGPVCAAAWVGTSELGPRPRGTSALATWGCARHATHRLPLTAADMPTCPAAGLDGCNSTTLVLVGEALSGNNSFVSPLVSSFTKQYKPQDILLTAKQGIVIPPTAADAAAAAASSNPDSAWLGCIVAPNAAMAGTLVEVRRAGRGAGCCARALETRQFASLAAVCSKGPSELGWCSWRPHPSHHCPSPLSRCWMACPPPWPAAAHAAPRAPAPRMCGTSAPALAAASTPWPGSVQST